MNKTAIKNFAVWARNKLIADISYRAGLIGITESGIASALPQSTGTTEFYDIGTAEPYSISGDAVRQRRRLVELIERKEKETDYKTAYKYIIEEVAYTWFNRFIAIRFMEVNDYLPSHIRVLSSESGKMEPDLVTTPFEADLDFTNEEEKQILLLKDKNEIDELFRMLFVKQCNDLNKYLPDLFEKTSDYTELLLNVSVTDKEGIIYHLVNDIREADFNVEKEGQVEIIGWLYQFYNIEPKAAVFSKKSGKITKNEIPAATQLFTPDWIVRYMTENSLGRLWIEGHPNKELEKLWRYYLPETGQISKIQPQIVSIRDEFTRLSPEDIKVIDPCMGSGHILVYCFDVLMQIYETQGYSQRDAAQLILENNLYGLDIDKRAAQLSYFAIMMKARQYDRRFLSRGIRPQVFAIEESNGVNRTQLKYFGSSLEVNEKKRAFSEITELLDAMRDAAEYGSVLNIKSFDWVLLRGFVDSKSDDGQMSFETLGIDETQELLFKIINVAQIIAQKYDVVITNPPYMGVSAADVKLNEYIKKNYPDSKTDLFAVFIERCKQMLLPNRFQAMITMHSWMFLSSYEKLRAKILKTDIVNMVHLGARAFEEIGGEVVQTTSFIFRNSKIDGYMGVYCRLVDENSQKAKEEAYLNNEKRYYTVQDDFTKVSGQPIAYWIPSTSFDVFEKQLLGDVATASVGIQTGDNNKFLHLWWEVNPNDIKFDASNVDESYQEKKWFPYNKGGEFRKWYGNDTTIINWKNDGEEIKSSSMVTGHHYQQYADSLKFKPLVTWSRISTGTPSFRMKSSGFLSDMAGFSLFAGEQELKGIIAFCNSKVAKYYLDFLAPTLNIMTGQVLSMPYIVNVEKDSDMIEMVDRAIALSKEDWDCFECSWDFKIHPLAVVNREKESVDEEKSTSVKLATIFESWEKRCEKRFSDLKSCEEQINERIINLYGLQQELAADVPMSEVSVNKAEIAREVKGLISYAVGCMFGRYSLDKTGLVFAGGKWNPDEYTTFIPDKDNCIPITDEEYFHDDIVGLFIDWVKKVYGTTYFEENIDFIADALGTKGSTAREIIRNYFLNDFYKDHCAMYSVTGSGKRPIYWLFDSGKQNGFKALVYMSRWNADTIGNIRVDYLHRVQRIYESEINRMQDTIDHSTNAREVGNASKRKEKLQKQLKECREYDEKIGHLALSRIDIDLDDGVKVNYEKVQTASDGKKYQVLAKI